MDNPIRTTEELERFLNDLTARKRSVHHRDVLLETFYGGPSRGLFSFFSSLVDSMLWRFGGQRRGFHVRVWLPVPVATDLLLESRPEPVPGGDPLEAHFTWSATSERRVRAYLEGRLSEALVRLSADYSLSMTDRYLDIGPLLGSATTAAVALDGLIDVLPQPPHTDDEEAPTDGDPAPVVVGSTTSRMQADLWRSVLEAAEVPCHVRGYEQSPPWGSATPMVPISILVPARESERARELLQQAESSEIIPCCYNCGGELPEGAEWCPECRIKLGSDSTDPPQKL